MVKHIIAIKCRDEFTQEEKLQHKKKIKQLLEELKDKIPGIIEFTVHIDLLPTSNRDIVFDTLFVSQEALNDYQTHPEHVKAAEYVRSVMQDRVCIDYEI